MRFRPVSTRANDRSIGPSTSVDIKSIGYSGDCFEGGERLAFPYKLHDYLTNLLQGASQAARRTSRAVRRDQRPKGLAS